MVKQFRKKLYIPKKNLYGHIWDDDLNDFTKKNFWGVGNGWALAGTTRVIRSLPDSMIHEKEKLIRYVKDKLDGCLVYLRDDGLFHDVVDQPDSFVETNTSQMLAYTIFRGLSGKWLDRSYLKYAERMRQAVYNKVDQFEMVRGYVLRQCLTDQ